MTRREQKLKIEGGIECLQNLLDDARAHLRGPITERDVESYLRKTKKILAKEFADVGDETSPSCMNDEQRLLQARNGFLLLQDIFARICAESATVGSDYGNDKVLALATEGLEKVNAIIGREKWWKKDGEQRPHERR